MQLALDTKRQRDYLACMQPRYLLLDEAAALLRFDVTAPGRPREALLAWMKSKHVPVIKRSRRVWLVDRFVLEKAMEVV